MNGFERDRNKARKRGLDCTHLLGLSTNFTRAAKEDFTQTHGASLAVQEQGQKQKQVHDEMRKTTGRVADTGASREAGKQRGRVRSETDGGVTVRAKLRRQTANKLEGEGCVRGKGH